MENKFNVIYENDHTYNEAKELIMENYNSHIKTIYIGKNNTFQLYTDLPKDNIFSALTYEAYVSKFTMKHNDTSVLIIDLDIVPQEEIDELIEYFKAESFDGGRHQRRVNYITEGDNIWK